MFLDICTWKQERNTEEQHFLIRRYSKSYFHILVFESRAIQVLKSNGELFEFVFLNFELLLTTHWAPFTLRDHTDVLCALPFISYSFFTLSQNVLNLPS